MVEEALVIGKIEIQQSDGVAWVHVYESQWQLEARHETWSWARQPLDRVLTFRVPASSEGPERSAWRFIVEELPGLLRQAAIGVHQHLDGATVRENGASLYTPLSE